MLTKGNMLLTACGLLMVLSISVLTVENFKWRSAAQKDVRWFQNLTGGLGMGAVKAPAWNVIDFDPRLQPVDESKIWPIPGSYPYSPTSASSVTSFRETKEK